MRRSTVIASEIIVSVESGEADFLFDLELPGPSRVNRISALAIVDHPVVIPPPETVRLSEASASCAPVESACAFTIP